MLIEADDAHFAALLAGGPVAGHAIAGGGIETPEILAMLRGLAAEVRTSFRPAAWLIVEDGIVVGLCSPLGAPENGEFAIGYGVAASCRRRGIAARAIADVVAWAATDPRLTSVSAETAVDNIASQNVLTRNGFTETGRRIDDEDGPLIRWFRAT